MKPVFALLFRAVSLLLLALLLVAGIALTLLGLWGANRTSALAESSRIAATKAGPVEFQTRGDGPAVLVLHGGFGGYDQGMVFIPGLAEAGFQIISPSRPGYLRTPLATGETNEQQADAMAALLDTLGVQDAAVVGISAGGPVAIQFALRHPGRTRALVLVCAIAEKSIPTIVGRQSLARWALHSRMLADLGSWYTDKVAREDPRRALDAAFRMWGGAPSKQRAQMVDGVMDDPAQLALFHRLVDSTVPLGARLPGIRNDLRQLIGLGDLPFEQIHAPTLVIHGTADKAVKIAQARLAASRIPGATLCELEGSGHLLVLGPRGTEAKNKIIGFLTGTSGTATR